MFGVWVSCLFYLNFAIFQVYLVLNYMKLVIHPSAGKKYLGGNSICPRQTPDWQKSIRNFMIQSTKSSTRQKENLNPENENENEEEGAGCSKEDRCGGICFKDGCCESLFSCHMLLRKRISSMHIVAAKTKPGILFSKEQGNIVSGK